MGKDKENELVDEASEESFPASDPPAWTASPRAVTPPAVRVAPAPVARLPTQPPAVDRQTSRIPAKVFLWSGLALAATSVGLMAAGRRNAGLLAGLAAPAILLAGLYQLLPSDRLDAYRQDLH